MVKVAVYVFEDTALIEAAVAGLLEVEPQREALLFPEARLHPAKHGEHALVCRFEPSGTLVEPWPFGFFTPLNDRGGEPRDPTPEAP